MPIERSEPGTSRRAVAAGLTAAVLLTVTAYTTIAEAALARVRGARFGALLADLGTAPPAQLDQLSDGTVRAAIAAAPLDQRALNVAMVRDAKRHGGARTPTWLAALSQLGWRDTVATQNRLYAAALRNDLAGVLDLSDALLRRQQLMDPITKVVTLLEAEPRSRPALIDRLAAGPSWRNIYLATTIGYLKTPEQLSARVLLLNGLARRGPLGKSEVVPSINLLDGAGRPGDAFELWQRVQPGVTRPLDDTRFDRASRSYDTGLDPVPFEWQLMTGEGFSADAVQDGAHAALTIDWNGRGVPVFAQQRTSGAPGRYALDLDVPAAQKADVSVLSFRLVCGETPTALTATAGDPARLRTATAVPCAFPMLQIVGDVQSSAVAHQVTIRRIVLRRLDAGPEAE